MPRSVQDALTYAEEILATVREPLVVLDPDLRVRSANRSFYRTFAVTPEDTEGRLLYDLGNGQWGIPRLRALLTDILPRDTTVEDYEVEHDFPGLGHRHMLLNARKVYREGNHLQSILMAIEDITGRKKAERARHEAETRFTAMVKNVRDHSIFLTDPEGVITSWNLAAERVLGYTEAEAVGQNFAMIFTPEDLAAGLPQWELTTAREEGRAEDERWHVKKGGEWFWALGIVTPMCNEHGEVTGFSKILRDITGRKRLEEALREADRRKDEFLATLAHELRNPLVPIRNAAEIIRMVAPSDRAIQGATEMIDRHVSHLGRLVGDLLDVAGITARKVSLRKEPVELAAILAYAVDTARPGLDARGHELTVTVPPQGLRLDGDRTRLTQVFTNLLTNAAKYTPEGGRVWLTAEREGPMAVVRVRDTGVGIPAQMLSSVFDLFTQVDRSEGGLGIGLSLVKSIVEMHRGSVEAWSDGHGKGSEFTVRLPAFPG